MGKTKFKLTKKQVLGGVGVVILLLLAVGVGFLVQFLSQQAQNGGNNNDGSDQAVVEDERLQGTLKEVQQLRTEGNTEEANKKIDEGLNDPNVSNDDKYILYLQKGSAQLDAGQAAQAAATFEQAKAVSDTREINSILGDAYVAAGNNPKAIEAYKRTIQLISPNSPLADADKANLEQTIRNLGGQP